MVDWIEDEVSLRLVPGDDSEERVTFELRAIPGPGAHGCSISITVGGPPDMEASIARRLWSARMIAAEMLERSAKALRGGANGAPAN